MASTYLSKTFSSGDSSGNGQKKFTVSAWVKKSKNGENQDIVSAYKAANGFQCDVIRLYSSDLFGSFSHSDSGGSGYNVRSNAVLRDTNAFYHLVTAVDTTQSTSSDRVKLYINGEQVTSLSASTYPAQNESLVFGMPTDAVHEIGAVGTSAYFDGVISHVHICFNQQYDASAFGETDSTTGEWKIKTDPSVSYGSIGGWYLKDAANGTDYSSNSNTYTVNGTLTKTEDSPSNVFATLDALQDYYGWHDLSNGNTSVSFTGSTRYGVALSNLGMTSGKYYCEVKCVAEGSPKGLSIGLVNKPIGFGQYEYLNGNGYAYWRAGNGTVRDNAGNTEYTGNTWGTGDILMMALDCDNRNLYFGKNGTWENSGVPTSGSTGTGAVTLSTLSAYPDYPFFFACDRNDSGNPQFSWNFGNGYFGTTAVSSAGTNASGNGIFEYDVPTGFTALSTKGLNT